MVGRTPVVDESLVLVLERVFDAPRELVWEIWTDEKLASQWWGPQGFEVVYLEMDVRSDGKWRKCMRSEDGREFWRRGVFREVVTYELLTFTYFSDDPNSDPGHETVVTVRFESVDAKTRVTLRRAVFESTAARDAHRGGWSSALEHLGKFLADSESC